MTGGRPRRALDAHAARVVAADLLSRRAWTRRELLTRLERRGAPPGVAAAVVGDLVARGHVDDAAFARHWVDTRGPRGYGPARLRAELGRRGVPRPLIDAALRADGSDDLVADARALGRKRLPVLRRGTEERLAARLGQYLLRRGYPPAVVGRVVRELAGGDLDPADT